MILLDILSGLIGIATAVIGTMMVAVFVVGLPVVLLWPFVLAADEIVRAGKAQGKW